MSTKLKKRRYAYRGIYLLEEKVTRGPDRVDVEKADKEDSDATVGGGYVSICAMLTRSALIHHRSSNSTTQNLQHQKMS